MPTLTACCSLVLLFPLAFILHDAEEIAVQHQWMLAHRETLSTRFPFARPLVERLARLDTKAFAIAALEELVVLLMVTAYEMAQGPGASDELCQG